MRPGCAALCVLLAFAAGFGAGYIFGSLRSDLSAKHQRYLSEAQRIAPLLSDPAYSKLEICEASVGHAYLMGRVASGSERDRLRARLATFFGDELADFMILHVASGE